MGKPNTKNNKPQQPKATEDLRFTFTPYTKSQPQTQQPAPKPVDPQRQAVANRLNELNWQGGKPANLPPAAPEKRPAGVPANYVQAWSGGAWLDPKVAAQVNTPADKTPNRYTPRLPKWLNFEQSNVKVNQDGTLYIRPDAQSAESLAKFKELQAKQQGGNGAGFGVKPLMDNVISTLGYTPAPNTASGLPRDFLPDLDADGGFTFNPGELGKDWSISYETRNGKRYQKVRVNQIPYKPEPVTLGDGTQSQPGEYEFGLAPGGKGTYRHGIGQAFGSPVGQIGQGVIQGGLAGAGVGSLVAPGVGTLIGGALGTGIAYFQNRQDTAGDIGSRALGAMGGAAIGASIGSVIPVIGTAIGAIAGGIGGLLAGPELLNLGADTVERAFGTTRQLVGAAQEPEKYGTVSEVLNDFGSTWNASKYSWETLETDFRALAPANIARVIATNLLGQSQAQVTADYKAKLGDDSIFNKAYQLLAGPEASLYNDLGMGIEENISLFQPENAVFLDYDQPDTTGGVQRLVEMRRALSGYGGQPKMTPEELGATVVGAPAMTQDLILQMAADPLNNIDEAQRIAFKIGNRADPLAMDTLKAFRGTKLEGAGAFIETLKGGGTLRQAIGSYGDVTTGLDPFGATTAYLSTLKDGGSLAEAKAAYKSALGQEKPKGGIVDMYKLYRDKLIFEKPIRDGLEAKQDFNRFQRMLLGDRLITTAATGEYKPVTGPAKLLSLTPESAALADIEQNMNYFQANLSRYAVDESLPETWNAAYHAIMDNAADVDVPKDADDAQRFKVMRDSIGGRIFREANRKYASEAVDNVFNTWKATGDERNALAGIARTLGVDVNETVNRLTGLDENGLVKLAGDLKAKTGAELSLGALKDADALKYLKTLYGDKQVPHDLAHYQAAWFNAMMEGQARWTTDVYGFKPKTYLERLANAVKSLQSVALMNYNIGYFMQNLINGEVTMAARGVWGLHTLDEIKSTLNRAQLSPGRILEGIGIAGIESSADAIRDIQSFYGPEALASAREVIQDATKPIKRGAPEAMQDAARKAHKLGLSNRAAQWIEKHQSARAWYEGFTQMWRGQWRRGNGIPELPPALVEMLTDIDPRLPNVVYAAAESGLNPQEIALNLFDKPLTQNVDRYVADVARELGLAEADVQRILAVDNLGGKLNDLLRDRGENLKDSDVRQVFDRLRDETTTGQVEAYKQKVHEFSAFAAHQAKAGDIGALSELLDGMERSHYETFVEHDAVLAARVEAIRRAAPNVRNILWEKAMGDADLLWRQFRDEQVGVWQGLEDGFASEGADINRVFQLAVGKRAAGDTSPEIKPFSTNVRLEGERTAQFYKERKEIYDALFKRTKGNATEMDMAEARKKVAARYDAMIQAVYGDKGFVQRRDRAMAALFGSHYTKETRAAFRTWREGLRQYHLDDARSVSEFRKRTDGLDTNSRDKAWQEFNFGEITYGHAEDGAEILYTGRLKHYAEVQNTLKELRDASYSTMNMVPVEVPVDGPIQPRAVPTAPYAGGIVRAARAVAGERPAKRGAQITARRFETVPVEETAQPSPVVEEVNTPRLSGDGMTPAQLVEEAGNYGFTGGSVEGRAVHAVNAYNKENPTAKIATLDDITTPEQVEALRSALESRTTLADKTPKTKTTKTPKATPAPTVAPTPKPEPVRVRADKATVRGLLLEFVKGDEAKADAGMALLEARAKIWGKYSGRPAEEYWQRFTLPRGADGEQRLRQGEELYQRQFNPDLMVLHNTDARRLPGILELGGLPSPSLAIVRKTMSNYDKFGDVTFIGRRDMIDPQIDPRNLVYDADAYTPTFPTVEEVIDPRVMDRLTAINQRLRLSSYDMSGDYSTVRTWVDLAAKLDGSQGMMLYLDEMGVPLPEIPAQPIDLGRHMISNPQMGELFQLPELWQWVKDHPEILSEAEIKNPFTGKTTKAVGAPLTEGWLATDLGKSFQQAAIDAFRMRVERLNQMVKLDLPSEARDNLVSMMRQYYAAAAQADAARDPFARTKYEGEMSGLSSEIFWTLNRYKLDHLKVGVLDKNYIRKWLDLPTVLDSFFVEYNQNALKMIINGETTETNTSELARTLRETVRDTVGFKGFDDWRHDYAKQHMSKAIRVGDEYAPLTLDSATQAMTRLADPRMREFNEIGSLGMARAYGARQFASVDQMHSVKGRIKQHVESSKEYQEVRRMFSEFVSMAGAPTGKSEITTKWNTAENAGYAAMADYLRNTRRPNEKVMRESIRKAGWSDPSDAIVQRALKAAEGARKAGTDYYEAKPQRSVGFNEFVGVVIPDSVPDNVARELEKTGLVVKRYADEEVTGGDIELDYVHPDLNATADQFVDFTVTARYRQPDGSTESAEYDVSYDKVSGTYLVAETEMDSPNIGTIERNIQYDYALKMSERQMTRDKLVEEFYSTAGVLFSDSKGAILRYPDGAVTFKAFKASDVSTLVHELGHTFLFDLADMAGSVEYVRADLNTFSKWVNDAGITMGGADDFIALVNNVVGYRAEAKKLEALKTRTAEQDARLAALNIDIKRYVDSQEQFARGFERYMRDGTAPTPELEGLFKRFAAWLAEVYRKIKGSPIEREIPNDMRAVYDRLLADQDAIDAAARAPEPTLTGAGDDAVTMQIHDIPVPADAVKVAQRVTWDSPQAQAGVLMLPEPSKRTYTKPTIAREYGALDAGTTPIEVGGREGVPLLPERVPGRPYERPAITRERGGDQPSGEPLEVGGREALPLLPERTQGRRYARPEITRERGGAQASGEVVPLGGSERVPMLETRTGRRPYGAPKIVRERGGDVVRLDSSGSRVGQIQWSPSVMS